MKTGIIFSLITGTVAIIGGAALAGTPVSHGNGVTDRLTGNGAAKYDDAVFGPNTTCNETQHPKFDTVSCRLAAPNLALAGTTGTVSWFSDFDHSIIGTFTYTVSGDGRTYTGKATY